MNIAIFDHVGKKAGMDYYSSSLAKGFIKHQCKVDVYSNFVGREPDIIKYDPLYDGHNNGNAIRKFIRYLLATVKASYRARKQKSDLVILHLFSANFITFILIIIPKVFGLKTAVISHDVASFINNDSTFFQNFIYNTLSDYIIVHNQFSYEVLLGSIKIVKPSKVSIIKQGGYIDLVKNFKSKVSLREELGLLKDGKYILFFGQIKDVKGLDILLEAMSKVGEDIHLIIAGKPWKSDFKKYDDLICKYNLQDRVVKIIRFIEDDEREKLFLAADVNVLPYRVIYQSAVLLMAMSYGLPVIASNLKANEETIEDNQNGLLFKSEDPESLAEKIKLFFENESLKVDLAYNALQTITKDYDWKVIASKYINLLESENK